MFKEFMDPKFFIEELEDVNRRARAGKKKYNMYTGRRNVGLHGRRRYG